ncbi:hypothetical protein B484DRAFT_392088 [Ochromonadaceae sp. CCMP2298]|nr:hypothetical protein B484DRAFT_392088 [Ochromonadaceae sp. CCMP2298]
MYVDASQERGSFSLQIAHLSLVQQRKYKNCFIRILFDNQSRETSVRSSSRLHPSTSWDGTLSFDQVSVSRVRGSLDASADDLMLAVTGKALDPQVYLRYLGEKYREIYQV